MYKILELLQIAMKLRRVLGESRKMN